MRPGDGYTRLGDSGLERRLDSYRDDLRRLRVIDGPNYTVEHTTKGQRLKIKPGKGGTAGEPGVVKQYRLKSVQNDYLVCREFDGVTEGATDVNVAKPHGLRYTGWHGVVFNYAVDAYPGSPGTISVAYNFITPTYRTATSGTITEHQLIIPFYHVNFSVIFASQCENDTGVTGADWIDLNVDGRAWARTV